MRLLGRKPVTHSEFEFNATELAAFNSESEWIDYMEEKARSYLRSVNLPHRGGTIRYWFSYDDRPSTLTLMI